MAEQFRGDERTTRPVDRLSHEAAQSAAFDAYRHPPVLRNEVSKVNPSDIARRSENGTTKTIELKDHTSYSTQYNARGQVEAVQKRNEEGKIVQTDTYDASSQDRTMAQLTNPQSDVSSWINEYKNGKLMQDTYIWQPSPGGGPCEVNEIFDGKPDPVEKTGDCFEEIPGR